ncbi:CDP-diacylglycerol--glycerol-3-phosphate 3-phosphatidyltransferase [Desulfurivibrio alkaliphilus]|uniref:CDP-diacylglycerol--glycerol-3-phosphate 3-phosphatidyltransferase n=1 Tax=Desulfurivibrio alkaliphilus (strain DSM 19089 / UNIQEM U267 / AHT2) TaxID=589865 RepID=D6Z6C2_DESAT|nr:CDP-diacylglycerol--glycerol-3-phosphate 3-phosphatidyltransferase [Desulfurivibrio alkaliphilus]ADH86887.1 CDP-diacylglycerol/glycerol-3-phosphate 3-phosphatidyltransferase [Desulfurivibrio alkaliphilus AHT 2]
MPHRKIITLPNLLTAYRFAVVPFILLCLLPGAGELAGLVAFVLFLSGALTDLADGYFARKMQSESVLGKLMDPLADKVLIAVALIMLIPLGKVAAWVAFVILARELVITGFRGVAADAGIVIAAGKMGKLKSVFQYIALCVLIFPASLLPLPYLHEIGGALLMVAMVLTVWSGVEYFVRFQKLYLPTISSS